MTETADGPGGDPVPGMLACVLMVHTDPVAVHRLIAALDPFPVFLHCDAATPDEVFGRMTEGLPDRVTVMSRRRTAWASWENVAAELDGLRAALAGTRASHVALLTGTDYPLVSTAAISDRLREIGARSVTDSRPLPLRQWGHGGGFWRVRFRFRSWGRRMLVLPIPRRLPRDVVVAGGTQVKLLARDHAAAVLRVVDQRPELVRFWRTTWIPEETFVHSLLHSPGIVPGYEQQRVHGNAWFIAWGDTPRKSPPWLTSADLPVLRRMRDDPPDGVPALFARKFSAAVDAAVLEEIDRSFRTDAPSSA